MSEDAADETAIAAAIFAVDDALPLETAGGARLAARCQRTLGLDATKIQEGMTAYKQFMVLKAVSKDFDAMKLSPPPLVDEIWHEHILDTRGYRAFCDAAFKQFVDHDPDGVLDCGARSVRRERTLHKLKECFEDEYDKSIWTYPLENSFKRKYAVVRDEPGPQPSTSGGSLNIRVRDATGSETFFKIKKTTKMHKIFHAWCTRMGKPVTAFRFLFDGQRVDGEQTAEDIDMEDGDQIDALYEVLHLMIKFAPSDATRSLVIPAASTVAVLRTALGLGAGPRFVWMGRLLDDDTKSLVEYGVENGQAIIVQGRPSPADLSD